MILIECNALRRSRIISPSNYLRRSRIISPIGDDNRCCGGPYAVEGMRATLTALNKEQDKTKMSLTI